MSDKGFKNMGAKSIPLQRHTPMKRLESLAALFHTLNQHRPYEFSVQVLPVPFDEPKEALIIVQAQKTTAEAFDELITDIDEYFEIELKKPITIDH